jgi:SAM-dependent methyltransferase
VNAALSPMNAEDLKVYACPQCRSNLKATAGNLECTNCGKSYEIRDGIPDFLLEDLAQSAHPVLRKVRMIDLLARIYETKLWYPQVLRLAAGKDTMTLPDLIAWVQEVIGSVSGYVLDVACGPGTFGRHIANSSRRVYGIDISTGMLKRGVNLARREQVTNISFARAQAETLPFEAETFDAAICGGSLHLFADAVVALREISRTLKSDSPMAIITVTSGPAGLLQFRRVFNYARKRGLRMFEVPALEQMLGEAGFKSCQCKTSGSLLTVRAEKRRS